MPATSSLRMLERITMSFNMMKEKLGKNAVR